MTPTDRRRFLQAASLVPLAAGVSHAADAPKPAKKIPFRLGMVTYNVAAEWTLPVLLQVCKTVGISPVELRTMMLSDWPT